MRTDVDHPREIEGDARYRAYLFGHPKIFRDNRQLALGACRKGSQHILLWFLLNPGKPFSADQFIDMLWPDTRHGKALSRFDVNLHALKRLLEPELSPRERSSFVHHNTNRVYSFESADLWWTDVADLELLYQRGYNCDIAGDLARARFYYRRISGYVSQGQLIEGEPDSWLGHYREKYALLCSHALARLLKIEIESGTDEELLESAYQSLRLDPHNQLATSVIIEVSLRKGNRLRAIGRLETFCAALRRDLGARPPREFVELRRRLLKDAGGGPPSSPRRRPSPDSRDGR